VSKLVFKHDSRCKQISTTCDVFLFINKYTRALELENMRHRTKEVSKQVSVEILHYD
jgi:hypothetical protein